MNLFVNKEDRLKLFTDEEMQWLEDALKDYIVTIEPTAPEVLQSLYNEIEVEADTRWDKRIEEDQNRSEKKFSKK